MHNNNNPVYGYCQAGCKFEVTSYEEFLQTAPLIEQPLTDDDNFYPELNKKYKLVQANNFNGTAWTITIKFVYTITNGSGTTTYEDSIDVVPSGDTYKNYFTFELLKAEVYEYNLDVYRYIKCKFVYRTNDGTAHTQYSSNNVRVDLGAMTYVNCEVSNATNVYLCNDGNNFVVTVNSNYDDLSNKPITNLPANYKTSITGSITSTLDLMASNSLADGIYVLTDGDSIDIIYYEQGFSNATIIGDHNGYYFVEEGESSYKLGDGLDKVGLLSNLTTTNKDNLVAAINEVNAKHLYKHHISVQLNDTIPYDFLYFTIYTNSETPLTTLDQVKSTGYFGTENYYYSDFASSINSNIYKLITSVMIVTSPTVFGSQTVLNAKYILVGATPSNGLIEKSGNTSVTDHVIQVL